VQSVYNSYEQTIRDVTWNDMDTIHTMIRRRSMRDKYKRRRKR